ncbi:M64 family metallopeptidase [Nocardia sp. NPDC057030]|uniref:M64 family metallopeptidase n=1 Tax=unclassified Nocardia TaxID=2637762 RepID=UPI0036383B30
MRDARQSRLRDWLRTDAAASTVPWIGDSMTTLFQHGPLGAKITVVVVGDGFGPRDQEAYNQAVDNLLTNGLFAQDFFKANKSAFNLLRINLVSVDSGISTKTYDASGAVVAQVNHNTALGAFYNGDWAHCWVEDGAQTGDRLARALSIWVSDHRLVVLLLNNPGFGGCGGSGRATLPLGVSWSTIAHEFGHALGGLGDEYHQTNNQYTGGEPGEPNLTINTDRATVKWAGDIDQNTPIPTGGDDYRPPKPAGWDDNKGVGLFEGGAGSFDRGVFRPVVDCRMRSNSPAFCPVCERAMAAQTAPRLPVSALAEESENAMGAESYVRLLVHVDNGELSIVEAREVEGPLVQPGTLTAGLAHELFLGDRRVSVGSHPDAGISRSFSEIGPDGPRAHHTYAPEAFDFVVRVPTGELRAAASANLTLNLVSLDAPTTLAAGTAAMAEGSEANTALVATTGNLTVAELPQSLRRFIEAE